MRKQQWQCEIAAPSRITRSVSEQRIKTDRRDALMLARQLRSADLSYIMIPEEQDAAMREVSIPYGMISVLRQRQPRRMQS